MTSPPAKALAQVLLQSWLTYLDRVYILQDTKLSSVRCVLVPSVVQLAHDTTPATLPSPCLRIEYLQIRKSQSACMLVSASGCGLNVKTCGL